ncbi:hypothetical protein ACFLUX_01370 [Chloroflexota bacterium]
MEIGDWITLFAVIVALGIGIASILHTQNLQKKEQRQKLLNEIIDWAKNITKYRFSKACKELLQITDSSGETSYKKSLQFIHANVEEVKEAFAGLEIQSRYICKITSTFGAELYEAAQDLAEKINGYINYLREWSGTLADEIEEQKKDIDIISSASKADEIGLQMDDSARKLMEEAAEVKTKNIS